MRHAIWLWCTMLHLLGAQLLAQSVEGQLLDWRLNEPQPVQAEVRNLGTKENYEHLLVAFPSQVSTPEYPQNQIVWAEVFVPRQVPGKVPAVVILHSWGVHKPDTELALARTLTKQGMISAVLTLPYHVQRTPSGYLSGELMIVADVQRMRETMRQSVLDTMRLIDWLQSQPQVAPDRMGVVGISLGAIIGAVVLGWEQRLNAGVLILGGANLADILWRSPLTLGVRSELRGKGLNYQQLKEGLDLVEPSRYLSGQYGERVLMINGRYDMVIPRESARALRQSLGEGPILWLNTGHYGPALVRPALFNLVKQFFISRLEDPSQGFRLPRTLNEPTIRIGLLHSGVWGTRVSAAIDVWQWEREGRAGIAAQISPRNLSLLVGFRPILPVSLGLEISSRPVSGYVLYHFVL